MLGLVGGLSGIIWSVMAMVLGGYQEFKFENSLIGQVYPTSPSATNCSSNERDAKRAIMRTVSERGKYWYNYPEFMLVSFLSSCCCCFCKEKPGSWYEEKMARKRRHEAASEKLANEIDIVKLLYVQRVGQFIAKLILNKHQRALVTSFSKNIVDDLGAGNAKDKNEENGKLLEPSIQEDNDTSEYAIIENTPGLS